MLGAISCAYLASPLTDRDSEQYRIAAVLLAIGVGLWVLTRVLNRMFGGGGLQLEEPERLSTGGPHN